jgi:hypothetical protein
VPCGWREAQESVDAAGVSRFSAEFAEDSG